MKLCQFSCPVEARGWAWSRARPWSSTSPRRGPAWAPLPSSSRGRHGEPAGAPVRALARAPGHACRGPRSDRAPTPRGPTCSRRSTRRKCWGAGITYRRSREYYEAHTGEGGRTKGIYDYVYEAERPELFFKATASRTVGPTRRSASQRLDAHGGGAGAGVVSAPPAPSSATRWATTSRPGTSSGRTRSSCPSPRCSTAASRWARCSSPPARSRPPRRSTSPA